MGELKFYYKDLCTLFFFQSYATQKDVQFHIYIDKSTGRIIEIDLLNEIEIDLDVQMHKEHYKIKNDIKQNPDKYIEFPYKYAEHISDKALKKLLIQWAKENNIIIDFSDKKLGTELKIF